MRGDFSAWRDSGLFAGIDHHLVLSGDHTIPNLRTDSRYAFVA